MSLKNLFPLDIEKVETETDAHRVNAMVREGWLLLLVYPTGDGAGGFFAVYVLGKRRAISAPSVNPDPEGFDQRHG